MTEQAVRELVDGLNELLRRLPRIAGNFVAMEVPCSLSEVMKAYPENDRCWIGNTQPLRTPDFSRFGHAGEAISLTSLLSALCPRTIGLSLKHEQGLMQVEVVSTGFYELPPGV